MSLASYIGCNVEIPLTDPDSNDVIVFGPCFQMKVCLKLYKSFNFKQVTRMKFQQCEVLNLMSGKQKGRRRKLKKLIALCTIMEGYLNDGDYFELFSCWVGNEDKERLGELKLKINHFHIDEIRIPERTLVRIEK